MTQQAAMSCNRNSLHRFNRGNVGCWSLVVLCAFCLFCCVFSSCAISMISLHSGARAMWVGPTAVSAAGPLLQRSGGTLRAGFGQSFSRGQLTHHHHRHLISSENLTPAIQSPDNPPSRALRQSRLCVALEWRPASQGGNCSNGGTTKPSFRIPAGAGEPLRGR